MTSRHTSTQDKQSLFQRILYSIFPGMLRERKEGEGYRGFFNTLILHDPGPYRKERSISD